MLLSLSFFPQYKQALSVLSVKHKHKHICKRCYDRPYGFTTEIHCGTGDNSRTRWTWCCSMRMTIRSGGTERARWVGSPGRYPHTTEVYPSSGTCSWKLLGKKNPTMWFGRSTFLMPVSAKSSNKFFCISQGLSVSTSSWHPHHWTFIHRMKKSPPSPKMLGQKAKSNH